MDNLLLLVDGSSYFYRAFHALPPLSNSKGQATGAVYGVINMLKKTIEDYQPQYVAVVFDAKGKTFRDELYSDYKANRPSMPDELRSQITPLHGIIQAMGLPLLVEEGVEADDVIGTLALKAKAHGIKTIISTGDKDMAQLVCDEVELINTMNQSVLDIPGVHQKFGVGPEQIIDYLSLIGDKVDNVPGVPKVGPKTAVKWLKEYHSLDGIMANASAIGGKVGENLRASLNFLPLSKKLITIKCDLDLAFSPESLLPQAQDKETLLKWYQDLEFKTWTKEISDANPALEKKHSDYETIFDEQALEQWLKRIKPQHVLCIDTETTSLDTLSAKLVGISLSTEVHQAVYIPLGHDYEGAPKQLTIETAMHHLKPLLEDERIPKLGQNLKYDLQVLANYGINLKGIAFDTMLESYVLDASQSRHDMDTLALKHLGISTIRYEDIAGKGAKQLSFNQIPLEKAAPYAAEDADITLQLHHALWPRVEQSDRLHGVFKTIELPLLSILAKIEHQGVLIDAELLEKQGHSMKKRIAELKEQAYAIAEEEFNLSSPKQLQNILFEKLKLPILQKTPKGQASTAENVLQELAYDYPLPKIILEYRSLSKLLSTYIEALPKRIHSRTQRVHTSFNQAVTATGRLSSSEPNLQNIPIRREEGRQIRRAFIAPAGYKLLAADYSQIELRIMAHLSQDINLLKAFSEGLDVHAFTASEVFGVPLDKVSFEQRRSAKAINFGLIYGMSAFGLAKQLDISREQAQAYVDAYFARYPGVERYMQSTREQAHEQGYVETLMGRRLYLPEINARNMMRQRAAERTAINAPMQGTAADIIKLAMISIDKQLNQDPLDAKMIMQVHDELVFEVAENQLPQAQSMINSCMESAMQLDVPLEVSIGVGDNWEEAH